MGDYVLQKTVRGKYPSIKIYFWVLSYLKPQRWNFVLLIICILTITAIEMIYPLLIQTFVDYVEPKSNYRLFYLLIVLTFVSLIFLLSTNWFSNLLERTIKEKASRGILETAFVHLRKLGFPYFDKISTGKIYSMFNSDISDVQKIYRTHLPGIVKECSIIIVLLVFLSALSFKLTLIMSVCSMIYYLIGPLIEKKEYIYRKKSVTLKHEINRKIYESISSQSELRAYQREKWDISILKEMYIKHQAVFIPRMLYAYIRGSLRRLSIFIGAIFVFYYGSLMVQEQLLSIGQFVAFTLYCFIILRSFTELVTHITDQKMLLATAERLHRFMKETPMIIESENVFDIQEITGRVEFRNVYFHYDGCRQTVLNGVSLEIKPGEHLAIVGVTGQGKSTLVKLLPRFYDTVSGDIYIDGQPIKQMKLSKLRESISFVFQDNYLFGGTIFDNIHFGNPHATYDEVIEAAKKALAHDFIMELTDHYHTIVGERGYKLSGGQKQRIALARMFLKNAPINILDESTSSLDYFFESKVQEAIETNLKGKTIITIAHRLSTVKNADRILVLNNGRIEEEGDYYELLDKKGIFFNLIYGSLKKFEGDGDE